MDIGSQLPKVATVIETKTAANLPKNITKTREDSLQVQTATAEAQKLPWKALAVGGGLLALLGTKTGFFGDLFSGISTLFGSPKSTYTAPQTPGYSGPKYWYQQTVEPVINFSEPVSSLPSNTTTWSSDYFIPAKDRSNELGPPYNPYMNTRYGQFTPDNQLTYDKSGGFQMISDSEAKARWPVTATNWEWLLEN